jgi:hypothetical protein
LLYAAPPDPVRHQHQGRQAGRLGIAPEVIEAQLGHAVADSLGRAYNRIQYIDQRQAMMQAWAYYLDKLRKGADVVPIKGKAA